MEDLSQNNNEDMRSAIYQMQIFLQGIRAQFPCVPFVAADGIYGEETTEAVRIFQTMTHLEPTGITNEETWNMARDIYYQMLRKNALAGLPNVFCDMEWDLEPDQCCDQVYVLQLMLRRLGEHYQEFSDLSMTGSFDQSTQDAFARLAVEGAEGYQVGKCAGKCQVNDLVKTYNSFQMCCKYHIWDKETEESSLLEGIFQENQREG